MESENGITVVAPLFIQLSGREKAKKYHINLNQYRNWYYLTNNKLKVAYKDIVSPQLQELSFNKIRLEFTLFKGSKRKVDRANVLCIHEKFFCDALVEAGALPDDNDEYIESTHYYGGGIDRDNPRVEVRIVPL